MKKFILLFMLLVAFFFSQSQAQSLSVSLTAYQYPNGYNISVHGANDGSINATVSNAIGPVTFLWNDSVTTEDRSNLPAGTYSVLVTDSLDSTATATVTLIQPAAILPLVIFYEKSQYAGGYNISTYGGNNGFITVTVTGGLSPYHFLWNDGIVQKDRAGLSAGVYTVLATDSLGDSITASITMLQPGQPLGVELMGPASACILPGMNMLNAMVSGGTPPYQYEWVMEPNGVIPFTTSMINLPPSGGVLHVNVKDANLDSVTASYTALPLPPPLYANISPIYYQNNQIFSCDSCDDGRLFVSVSGGEGPYTYLWNNGTLPDASDDSLLNIPHAVTSFMVTVTDANGCVVNANYMVNMPPPPPPMPLMVTGTVSMYAMGNVTCATCFDGYINLTVTGGMPPYSFVWSNGATTQNLTAIDTGYYSVTVTDMTGATTNQSFNLMYSMPPPPPPTATIFLSFMNVDTAGKTVEVWVNNMNTAIGNFGFTLMSGVLQEAFGGIAATNGYTVNAGGPTAAMSMIVTANRNGNFIPTGNYHLTTLRFSGSLPAYNICFMGASGFTDTLNMPLAVSMGMCIATGVMPPPPPPMPLMVMGYPSSFPGTGNVSCATCADGSISLMINGGMPPYSFDWSNDSITQNISGLDTGYYSVTVTDMMGATYTQGFNIMFYTAPPPPMGLIITGNISMYAMGNVTCPACTDGWINLTVSGGMPPYSFDWSNDSITQNISNIGTGIYSVTVTDMMGATANQSFNLMYNQPPPPMPLMVMGYPLTYPGTGNVSCVSCSDGSITLMVSGGTGPYTYNWSNGAITQNISNVDTGYYSVTVTDMMGATITQGYNIVYTGASEVIETPLMLSVTKSEFPGGYNVSCAGCADGWASVTVTGGVPPYTFFLNNSVIPAWMNGQTFYNLNAGSGHVKLTDMNGDSVTTDVVMLAPSNELNVQLSANVQGGCNGGPISGNINAMVMGGTPPYTFQWSGPNGNLPDNWQNISVWQQGTYYVTVTDANSVTAQASVNVLPPPSVNVQIEAVEQYGQAHTACTISDGRIIIHVSGGLPPYNVNVSMKDDRNRDMNFNGTMVSPSMQGYYYNINTNDTLIEIDSLSAGWYDVWVNDMSQCGNGNGIELRQAEPPRVSVGGTEYENGYYFSCDTCHDAQLSASVMGGYGNIEYHWFEIPQEMAGMTLKGASLFMSENKDFNLNELPPAISSSQTANITNAETLHGLVVADELGCVGFTNFTLEKPKPTNGWGFAGNNGAGKWLGTRDSTDLVIKTNNEEALRVLVDGSTVINHKLHAGKYLPAYGDSIIHFGETSILMRPTGSNKWIGTNSNTDLGFKTNNTTNLIIKSSGNIGIGTTSPQSKLEVNGDVKIGGNLSLINLVTPEALELQLTCPMLLSLGVDGSVVGLTPEDECIIDFLSATNSFWRVTGNFVSWDDDNFIGTTNEMPFRIRTNNQEWVTITTDGRVGINTGNDVNNIPDDYRLAVRGYIIAEDVDVRLFDSWPDYVFNKDYKLRSLFDLEKYINTNKHLPGIPDANTVKEDGVRLGEMSALTMEKVEELTLYMIQMNKENEALKQRIEQLEKALQNK
ncbi:MAG: hypothetical protein POELPBGB_02950 [Bacteroidia bacterium]|nr:hypothetical protein [Bacteroidia bacterium]